MGRDIIAAKEKGSEKWRTATWPPTFTFPAALTRKRLTKSNKECNANAVRIQHGLSSLKEIAAKEKGSEKRRTAKEKSGQEEALKNCRILCLLLLMCLTVGSCSGCGKEQEVTEDNNIVKNPYAGAVSMEGTPVIDYVVPRLLPNILVDKMGYLAGSGKKTAVVKGRKLPQNFVLVDGLTGEAVYRGALEEIVYHSEAGIYSGYADFSDYKKTGLYYVECDIIGRSSAFQIRDGQYTLLFEEIYGELLKSCRQKSITLSEAVSLLEVYEWYGEIFPDEDGDQVPDVLREMRAFVSYMEEKGTEENQEAIYAAFLAKFGYLYQKFDREYATDCLKRASTVFGQVKNTVGRDADTFFALTELYRATGRYTYRKQILDYKSFFEDNSSYLDEGSYLHGGMTYVATRQKVDMELCHSFTNNLRDRAEEISKHYEEMIDPVAARNNGPDDLLKGAVVLACDNYFLNNYQYTGVIEDFLHYLMGRNPESVCFYENGEDRSSYLLLLAQLAASQA